MNQSSRWRFSLRSLFAITTFATAFLASWEICRQQATSDIKKENEGWPTRSVAPYLFVVEKSDNVTVVNTYHLWLMGVICDLPYTRHRPETGGFYSVNRPRIIYQETEE